jgi:hypothetical protein
MRWALLGILVLGACAFGAHCPLSPEAADFVLEEGG